MKYLSDRKLLAEKLHTYMWDLDELAKLYEITPDEFFEMIHNCSKKYVYVQTPGGIMRINNEGEESLYRY